MELSGGNITAGRRFVWDGWSVATERLLSGTTGNCDSLLERCYVEGASLDEHLFAAIDGDLDGSLSTNLNVPVSASTSNTNDYEYYYLQNRLGSVMGLLDATDDRYMLEFYRYTIYGEATVLPLYDTGLNQIEDTPTDLSDNNSAMLATRTGGGDATAGRASTFNNQYTFTGRYLDAETGLHYFRYRYYESRTGRFISRDPAETPWTNLYSYSVNNPSTYTDPTGLAPPAVALAGIVTVYATIALGFYKHAMDSFPDSKGYSDKFRHCYVTCKLATWAGFGCAAFAAYGKEARDIIAGIAGGEDVANMMGEAWADLVADGEGLWCAVQFWRSCEDCCSEKYPRKLTDNEKNLWARAFAKAEEERKREEEWRQLSSQEQEERLREDRDFIKKMNERTGGPEGPTQ